MRILAVTACLTGVAHTYLAASALEKKAKARGIEIKIETQGAIGIENKITSEDVKNADVIILTKDIELQEIDRFVGKPIIKIKINDLLRKTDQILDKIEMNIKGKGNVL